MTLAADTIASLGAALAPRYTIERELGRGGMATIYLALDTRVERRVALKLLHPELRPALGPERFQREIQIAARLSHPNILPLYEAGEVDGRLFYTMPYVEGESLRQRLRREPQLPVPDAVRIATQVAAALAHAHGQGFVHRDIKPENILLADDQALVADFGIAKVLDAAAGEKLTETGLSLGTPAYMSPEQGSGGAVDARSDVYAVGCVTYEMLAGSPPFTGPTAQAVLARHAVDQVPPLRTVRATVPPVVERAVERALAKVPADRFATATEFADALLAPDTEPPRSRWRPKLRAPRVRARTFALSVLGVVTAAAAAAGAWTLRRASTPAVIPSAARIAVLPLASTGGDTTLTRLGRDLAVTISASLEGIGGIKTADRLSVATATANRPGLSAGEGAALARRLGARSVLRGTLIRVGDSVRVDLGLYATEGLAPLAEGITVTGHRDSVGPLTDSVTWALLKKVWQRGQPPSPSLDAVTTRAVPALRAFLDGEHHLAENRWNEASLAFKAALSADSTFALAYVRYYVSEAWMLRPVEPQIVDVVGRNLRLLPERDRFLAATLMDADRPGARITPLIERLHEATQRYPDFWPAWLWYGDALTHIGPMLGHDWTEALSALRRAVALNPDLVPAWEHIDRVAYSRDEVVDSRAIARLKELGWDGAADPFYSLEDAVVRAGGTIPTGYTGVADSLAAAMVSDSDPQALERSNAAFRLLRGRYPAAQIQLNQRALRVRQASPQARTALQAANSWAWATRGQWDSALAGLEEVARQRPGVLGRERYLPPAFQPISGPVLAIESYGLAVLGAWLGTSDLRTADERRPAALAVVTELPDADSRKDARGRIAWFDGLLGLTRQDRSAIRRARMDAARSGYAQAALVDRSLAAFDVAVSGDRRRAGIELASIEENCADYQNCNFVTPGIAVQRLAAAQWLAEAGEAERARRLLRWQDANALAGWLFAIQQTLAAPTFLLRARLEEQIGDRTRAIQYYGEFLRLYDQPMPSQGHLVEEAKAALARLSVEDRLPGNRLSP